MRATNQQSDDHILHLLRQRDESAISLLQQQYGSLCQQTAYRILGSKEDAEECVSDALMKLWQSIPPAEPANLRAYLLTCVRHHAFNRLESDHAQKRGGTQLHAALDEMAEVLEGGARVEEEIEAHQLKEAMERFLKTQKPEARAVFLRRYWMMESVSDIAKTLQMSEGKVKMMLMRMRKKLQQFLKKEDLI